MFLQTSGGDNQEEKMIGVSGVESGKFKEDKEEKRRADTLEGDKSSAESVVLSSNSPIILKDWSRKT